MDNLRQGNVTYMETKDYELQVFFGKPQPPTLTRIIENVNKLLSKTNITTADRMEIDALVKKYESLRGLSVVR
jgi:hypothetical protein